MVERARMIRSLNALLAQRLAGPFERALLHRLASHPGPIPSERRAEVEALGVEVANPSPGRPLLLAATASEGSLWTTARSPNEEEAALDQTARNAWSLTARVAARWMPVVANPAGLERRAPPAAMRLGDGRDRLMGLDGDSFGLPFLLHHISVAANAPIRRDLAATGVVTAEGEITRVERLAQKIDALRRWAPGISCLMVPEDQEREARALAPGLTILGVSLVEQAWSQAFERDLLDVDSASAHATDSETAARVAARYFFLVLHEPYSALRWKAVAEGCTGLRDHLDPTTRWHAQVAFAIASRHAGQPLMIEPPPAGMHLRRPLRLLLLAQQVQATNDSAEERRQTVIDEARAEIAPQGEEHVQDLALLGAVGRLHSAWAEYPEAREVLRRAIQGFLELDCAPDASYAICELARVAGLMGEPEAIREAECFATRCSADVRTTDSARTFLAFALGRAWAQAGDPAAARRVLGKEAAPWVEGQPHLRASRLRWIARVDPNPRPHREALAELARRVPEEAGFAWVLSRADAGEESALKELNEADASLLERCRRAEPGADWGRLLDLFPY